MLAAVFLPRGSEASHAPAAEAAEYGGARSWDADFTPIDGDVRRTEVTSAGEFLAALADPDSGTIVVTGGVNLAESLTLTKHVFVESGSLLVRAGNSLTVDGAIFCVNGMLCCDDLRVTGGGMAEIIGEWRGLTDESRISVSDGSWVYTRESILPLDEINVDATSMMLYSPAGGPSVSAHNARLRVGQLDSVSRPVTCRAVFPTLWGRVAKHGPGSKKG